MRRGWTGRWSCSSLLLLQTKLVIAARRTPEIPCAVMRTLSFIGIFNKRFDFLEKVLLKAGEKNRIRSKVSEGWNYI